MAVEAGDIVWRIIGDMKGLNQAMADARSEAQKNFGEISKQAGYAMTAAGAAITGALGVSIAKASEFNKAMAEVASLGVKDLAGLKTSIEEVAMKYGLDLTDAAKAAYQAISAGAKEADVPKILAASAEAATGGITDLTTAIDMVTSVNNAFGVSLTDTSKTFDQAFVAVKLGKTTYDELAASVGKVAPTMSALGLQTSDMYAAVAALSVGGINTAESMTGLKAALANIIKPSKEAADMADLMGVEFDAEALRAKGLKGFLDDLISKIREQSPALMEQKQALEAQIESYHGNAKGLNALKKQYEELGGVSNDLVTTMSQFFGSVEGVNAILALTGQQSDEFSAALDEMNKHTGQTAEAFDQVVKNDPTFAFNQLKAEVTVLAIQVGESLLPAMKRVIEYIKPLVEEMVEWIKVHPELTAKITETAFAVGAVMLAAGPLLINLPGIAAGFKLITTLCGPLATALGVGPGSVAIALAAVAYAAWDVYDAYKDMQAAQESLKKAQESWAPTSKLVIEKLQEMGIEINKIALSTDDLATRQEQLAAVLHEAAQRQRDDLSLTSDAAYQAYNKMAYDAEASAVRTESVWTSALKAIWADAKSLYGVFQNFGPGSYGPGPVPGYASGGITASDGWAMVGEQGPELVYLPGQSRVMNAGQTDQVLHGTAGRPNVTVNVNFGANSVRSEEDIRRIDRGLATILQTHLRGVGLPMI